MRGERSRLRGMPPFNRKEKCYNGQCVVSAGKNHLWNRNPVSAACSASWAEVRTEERRMKKLGFMLAVVLLLSILAAGIAAAATLPGVWVVSANASAAQSEYVSAGKGAMATESRSTFGQHGFCDQDDYAT